MWDGWNLRLVACDIMRGARVDTQQYNTISPLDMDTHLVSEVGGRGASRPPKDNTGLAFYPTERGPALPAHGCRQEGAGWQHTQRTANQKKLVKRARGEGVVRQGEEDCWQCWHEY